MSAWTPETVNLAIPNPARIYDYWLGGKDNYPVDREVGELVAQHAPWVRDGARANRAFLIAAVRQLARAGITQFLELGSGLPTACNVHEAAAQENPDARVVYVDNDPVVLTYARALLTRGSTAICLRADLRQPQSILTDAKLRDHIDLTKPVAVLMAAVLHFIPDDDDPASVVGEFLRAAAPGSYLAISHVTDSGSRERAEATRAAAAAYTAAQLTVRSAEQVRHLFGGLDLITPGLVSAEQWAGPRGTPPTAVLAGIGRTPTAADRKPLTPAPGTPASVSGRDEPEGG